MSPPRPAVSAAPPSASAAGSLGWIDRLSLRAQFDPPRRGVAKPSGKLEEAAGIERALVAPGHCSFGMADAAAFGAEGPAPLPADKAAARACTEDCGEQEATAEGAAEGATVERGAVEGATVKGAAVEGAGSRPAFSSNDALAAANCEDDDDGPMRGAASPPRLDPPPPRSSACRACATCDAPHAARVNGGDGAVLPFSSACNACANCDTPPPERVVGDDGGGEPAGAGSCLSKLARILASLDPRA